MAHIILHHNGAYNIYSTIVDAPLFTEALTLNELEQEIQEESGQSGLRKLPERLERAHKNGNSGLMGDESLEDFIVYNRAGEHEKHLSYDKFIETFMTLKLPTKAS